ncbi:hypothetical protein CJF32_00009736 [Rutstroemia sp. NJR-2017a WRK4]|nr:hypothetical protein CJF32_00009736 [Rutstroemia sp. NJR-2017a WRK4]
MWSRLSTFILFLSILFTLVSAQVKPTSTKSTTVRATTSSRTPPLTGTSTSKPQNGTTPTSSGSSSATGSTAPDVYLNVPKLSVGRIELDVENLQANLNLAANVASLVSINAGVAVSVTKVNLTISDVEAELELIVRLGHLVDVVNRVFQSLDLNPLIITALNNVTSIVDEVVGAVDGLLGSITQGGTTLSFLVDNLGNIVQEVGGVSTIVGDYLKNMTYTGDSKSLQGGLTQKTYSYSPLGALVNIVFNTAGQIVQAVVAKGSSSSTSASSSATATAAPTARRF